LYLGNNPALNTNAVYRISGGELECGPLYANQNVPALFEVVGTDPIVNFTSSIDIRHASTTLKFTLGATGVSTINVGTRANIEGATLEVDFSDFNFETSTLTLIDCGDIFGGDFGATNFIGEFLSADLVYDRVNEEVRLENLVGPPTGTIVVVQ
jgi:hypothetical protein